MSETASNKMVAHLVGTIRGENILKASIQIVPNTNGESSRVEVYDVSGRRMAYMNVKPDTEDSVAGVIGYSLYEGFIFGVEHIKYKMRQNFEAILLDNPTPDEITPPLMPEPQEAPQEADASATENGTEATAE